jgi:hypothetical protein
MALPLRSVQEDSPTIAGRARDERGSRERSDLAIEIRAGQHGACAVRLLEDFAGEDRVAIQRPADLDRAAELALLILFQDAECRGRDEGITRTAPGGRRGRCC